MRAVAVAVLLCASVAALPLSFDISELEPLSPDVLVQVGAFFKLHPSFNVTCDECHRMTLALQWVCHDHQAESTSLAVEKEFIRQCIDAARPVSPTPGFLKGRCQELLVFMREVYTPIDPCAQVTTIMNTAPNAICGLIRCTARHEEPTPVKPAPPVDPVAPLSCTRYLNEAISVCANQPSGANNSAVISICDGYNKTFAQEGCNLVVGRLQVISHPLTVCGALNTAQINATEICTKHLKLPATGPVPEEGYISWKTSLNTSDITLLSNGINITNATFGLRCDKRANLTEDNMLAEWRNLCQGRVQCTIPNPQRDPELSAHIAAEQCALEFKLVYSCGPADTASLHRVYGPANAIYEELDIDCTNEIPAYSTLDPLKHNPAGPTPLNHTQSDLTLRARDRPPASFLTEQMVFEWREAQKFSSPLADRHRPDTPTHP